MEIRGVHRFFFFFSILDGGMNLADFYSVLAGEAEAVWSRAKLGYHSMQEYKLQQNE
uniref:Uncharacterized protein n=1 Tax=Arundo donax TaxID=35708 RepID=A0A0A8ZGZ7_ARUDO